MSATINITDGVAVIVMNDGKANAINPSMVDALNAALDEAEARGDAKAVLITGLPGKFSAGFDLKYIQSEGPEAASVLVNAGGALALRLYAFRKPVVAAATGHAIAMGCFILQSCDVRLGTEGDYRIGANETAIGLVLPEFACQLLLARVRPDKLTEAGIVARLYSPHEAVEVGYLDRVVHDEPLMDAAMQTATALAALPARAYVENKHLIRRDTLAAIKESLAD